MIPYDVWKDGAATSNLIESVHSDVNKEGTSCTLLSGVTRGLHFDMMKMRSLEVC